MLALATLALIVGSFALWIQRQLLDTGNWATTSSRLIANPQIDKAVSSFLVHEVLTAPAVSGLLGGPLGKPVVAELRGVAVNLVARELATEPVRKAWGVANRNAHRQLLEILKGGGGTVSTRGGVVVLNLHALVDELAKSLTNDSGLALLSRQDRDRLLAAVPPQSGRLVIMRSSQLRTAQKVVKGIRGLDVALPIAALVMYALAVLLATGWRRRVVRAVGWCAIVTGVCLLVARRLIEPHVVGALVSADSVRPAANAAWLIATTKLRDTAEAEIIAGALIVGLAWVAGPTRLARALRKPLTGASSSSVRDG